MVPDLRPPSVSMAPALRRLRPTRGLTIAIFLMLGLLETVVALVIFNRTDDHEYYLAIANTGAGAVNDTKVEEYDLKARVAANVFYFTVAPVRWLGANESAYVLWLRLLTLVGFLCAFEGIRIMLRDVASDERHDNARLQFMALCLLYPGQLAWTASLLRDGLSCAFLFAAMLTWSRHWRFTALVLLLPGLALRPEFAVVIATMVTAGLLVRHFPPRRHRVALLLVVCWLVSLVAFEPRQAASGFAQYAYAEDGAAYPEVAHPLDLSGYLMVVLQSLVDPLSIAAPAAISPWGLAETVFFCWLSISGLRRLPTVGTRAVGLYFGLFVSMWLFAYFELYVSGFSRHRLALVVLTLAWLALTQQQRLPPGDTAPPVAP